MENYKTNHFFGGFFIAFLSVCLLTFSSCEKEEIISDESEKISEFRNNFDEEISICQEFFVSLLDFEIILVQESTYPYRDVYWIEPMLSTYNEIEWCATADGYQSQSTGKRFGVFKNAIVNFGEIRVVCNIHGLGVSGSTILSLD